MVFLRKKGSFIRSYAQRHCKGNPCREVFICAKLFIISGDHTGSPLQPNTVSARRRGGVYFILSAESILPTDVYVFFILRRRVQRYCTAVRGVRIKNIYTDGTEFYAFIIKYIPPSRLAVYISSIHSMLMARISANLSERPSRYKKPMSASNPVAWR